MNLTEAETRQRIIDERLRLSGWNAKDPTQVTEELEIDLSQAGQPRLVKPKSPYEGCRFADYGLLLHGKPIAVIEAKKTSVSAALGQEQAIQYAKNLQQIHGGPMPFVLYTNGHDIYFWESDFYPPLKVYGFPTKDDLEWFDQRRQNRRPLSVELINTKIVDRDYQIAAIRSILEAIEEKRKKSLLVMATGTGKTRTAAALTDVLIRARWARRILFLVDRIPLQEQALSAFKEHLSAEPRWPCEGDTEFVKNRRIYVETYQSMLPLIQRGILPESWISPHFFDVIIADESHRSIYNIYKEALNYFNALKIGLTATPTDRIEHDTFELFDCAMHLPTFAFSYEEAVKNEPPYLCDYEVLNVRSKFQLDGIRGDALSEEEQRRLAEEGIDIEDVDFEGTDLEKKVTNAGTNALILREFMEECIKDDSGTIPGKSIIFAVSKAHARRLQDIFDKLYPEHVGKLARVLVSDDRYVYGKGGLLDQFKTSDMPRIAISVDMLDTGVDIHEVVNLIFAKPVFSYTKFWQMIGRGTRLLESDPAKRKPWCTNKDKFLIIDCWNNFEYFKMNPRGKEPDAQVPLPVVLFRARIRKLKAAMGAGEKEISQAVIADIRGDIAALPMNSVTVIDRRADLAAVELDDYWERLTPDKFDFLDRTIAPILRARSGEDFKSMRFEIEVVDLGMELIGKNDEAIAAIRESIVEKVSGLPLTVNTVARHKDLIEEVKDDGWWKDIDEPKLQDLVGRLAPLMKYWREPTEPMMHLNLQDMVREKLWVEFGPHNERMPTREYRKRVETRIRQLVDENPVLNKIWSGESVVDSEIFELAEILRQQDPYVTEELLRKVYDHKTARFIQFIRHIIGREKLEPWRETVARSFDEFVKQHTTFTSLQIQFLQTLRTFILQGGRVAKGNLVEPPFTRIHPRGGPGVFTRAEIDEILEFADKLIA